MWTRLRTVSGSASTINRVSRSFAMVAKIPSSSLASRTSYGRMVTLNFVAELRASFRRSATPGAVGFQIRARRSIGGTASLADQSLLFRLREPREIAAGPSQTGDDADAHGIPRADEDDRDRLDGGLGRHRARRRRHDDEVDLGLDELVEQDREALHVAVGPALHYDDVLPFDVALLAEAALEGIEEVLVRRGRPCFEETDAPDPGRVLGAGHPGHGHESGRDGADEAPPAHPWITSSARASSDGGTVRPALLAVFRLMRSSSRVGCSTGRSLGFAPLRILST